MKEDNFEEYSIEDEEEQTTLTLPQLWRCILLAILLPASGWSALKKTGGKPERGITAFLLPVCILAALSTLFRLVYDKSSDVTDILIGIVVTFFSFFLGYFIVILIAKLFFPAHEKNFPSSDYGRWLSLTCIGTLALIYILSQALPMFDFIIEFFPLWTVYMLYKGMELAGLDRNKSTYDLGVMCVAVISSPFIINWFLSILNPIQ